MSPKISRETHYEPSEDIWLILEEYRKKVHTEGFKDTLESYIKSLQNKIKELEEKSFVPQNYA